ncbi:uncharacterized protein TRIADDRAFT_19963 [Trichoplax adhaerens]|uniref:SLC41A/MgtE integral membrane domain-containing protein n=1 Tax=Trichoplax adhaerens TaxID=10228 RepID=B3RI71_TRIAD|nr:hypothetical protein TRIADDRAFT_19963 [Trichoplax adhaerens]EDV28967.1 hypothetical protein TRIADDRAFT_19963 [Trichoplax adhaerens]|eukprot:XP_002108169.1 hypothetical protein TRIADDRAFT_19963 [Trichoplax adhaerens]
MIDTDYQELSAKENNVADNKQLPDQLSAEDITVDTVESSWAILSEVTLPFLIAGLGTVCAGLLLDVVQHWRVFVQVPEIFIMVPALLGLKGNLEMTLASRLSTASNLGLMDNPESNWKIITGNISLTQVQALVVGFLASLAAVIFKFITDGHVSIIHGLLLCTSSLITASLASLFLGIIMVSVILLSKKYNINPDNVATPIAASFGDLITLSLLSGISNTFYLRLYNQLYLALLSAAIIILLLPVLWIVTRRNEFTRDLLYSSWIPIVSAMIISSLGGLILDKAVSKYHGVAVFSPVVNGVGGNIAAVQASRISTFLHQSSHLGLVPTAESGSCGYCITKGIHLRSALLLYSLVVPGHMIFLYIISYLGAGHATYTLVFCLFYLIITLIQVALLLICTNWLVFKFWEWECDPDNYAIPYLTALGDLVGTGLLAAAFVVIEKLNNASLANT